MPGIGRPFQPGQSGNPSGRPAAAGKVRELAAEHGPKAIAILAELALDPKQRGSVRVAACSAILDRWVGRPTQAITGEEGAPIEVNAGEKIVEILRRLAGSAVVTP